MGELEQSASHQPRPGGNARCVATQKIEEGVFKKDDVLTIESPVPRGDGKGEGSASQEGRA